MRVKTVPDFEEAWIDAPITFLGKPKKEKGSPAGESEAVPETAAESLETENEQIWLRFAILLIQTARSRTSRI